MNYLNVTFIKKIKKMDRELLYRNLMYVFFSSFILRLFIQFDSKIDDSLFDIVYHISILISFTFAYLWLKRQIILFGVILNSISFNIDFLYSPFVNIVNIEMIPSIIYASSIIHTLGTICIILGFSNIIKNRMIPESLFFGFKTIIWLVFGYSIIFHWIVITL